MAVTDRVRLIRELEAQRRSKLISYIASTRINAVYEMQQMDIRTIANHVQKIGRTNRIDLFLHSFGGDITFPWRLVNLMREYAKQFHVIIPLHAFSAATLISLGADSITMLPQSCLGPTDPQSHSQYNPKDGDKPNSLPIHTEDVGYYIKFVKEDLEIRSEEGIIEALKILSASDKRVHPIALGHAKRGSKLAEKYAHDILSMHMKKKKDHTVIDKIVKTFGSELYVHEHPINRKEAKKLGLKVVEETPANEERIWKLYREYEDEMNLNKPFDPITEYKAIQPTVPLSQGNNLQVVPISIPPVKNVIVESESITDSFEKNFEVSGLRFVDTSGKINENYSWIIKSANWQQITR